MKLDPAIGDIFADKKGGQRKHPTFGGEGNFDANLLDSKLKLEDLTNNISPQPSYAGITKQSSDALANSGSD